MNWEAIGAVGELVGALSVVATLIYLATQIRQNTTSVRAATFQNIVGLAVTFLHDMAKDPVLRRIQEQGLAGEPLNEVDQRAFYSLMLGFLRRYENIHYQSRMGLLDDRQWQGLRASLLRTIRRPGFRSWWKDNAEIMNEDFREFIDHNIERGT